MKRWLTQIYYSFPCQLLVLHLRSNLLLIAIWMLLALFMMGNLGLKFGLRYLFMSPEYLGTVDFWSFFYLGVGFAAFLMSWNLTTYLLEAKYFSFLASMARPFTKFCLNNFIVPLLFIVLFLINLIHFGFYHEYLSAGKVFSHVIGFLFGIITLVSLIGLYFNFTNRDILFYRRYNEKRPPNMTQNGPRKKTIEQINAIKQDINQQRVDTYLTESFRARLVRSVAHYDRNVLLRVFKQNHTNALLVQLFSLVILVLLGIMIENPVFRIPTGASIFLLSSIIIAITGSISYWFQKWRMVVLLALFILINEITKYEWFHHENRAYGLDYKKGISDYSYASLEEICNEKNIQEDIENSQQILENWHSQMKGHHKEKPKIVFYCVSGGGLKATAWSMRVLQHADSLTSGKLMNHTMMMSGASGGMIGSAYFRELYLKAQTGEIDNIYDQKYFNNISRDLLNSISFTIVTNDLFIPWARFEKDGKTYHKDRGYIFEKQLSENTGAIFDKKLIDYKQPELKAKIPMMILTPSIVNDGRRMMISPQKVSYMMTAPIGLTIPQSVDIDAVDFQRLFENQEAENLSFSTAIRMNATYPYILPNVSLPTYPEIEVLDAGFRDNFGLKSSIRFIHVFKNWIQEHTSGVVIIIVRAYDRDKEIKSNENEGIFESFFNPLGIAGKILTLQNYEHDTNLGFIHDILGEDMLDIIRFTYRPSQKLKDAPVSFHITERQRRDIYKAISSEENAMSLQKLKTLLDY